MRVLNNLDWFGSMGFLTFLREVGKFARVGTMMAKDSVRSGAVGGMGGALGGAGSLQGAGLIGHCKSTVDARTQPITNGKRTTEVEGTPQSKCVRVLC